MKKILSLILAGLMTLSCAAFVAADDAAVDEVNTAEDYAIEFLANYGIFKGTSAAELVADADAPIQRYQMALFVSRISTGWVDDDQWEDGPSNTSTFQDIGDEPANKYLGALSYANQNGIIEGYSASKFAPYDGITYQDALTMVVRTLGYKGLAYPWGYIQKAVELGLTDDVNAAYTENLSRGQVAVIIYNAMFAATKSGDTLAKSIFDCDFGWENIVIVASNEASFASNGLRTSDGYVAFKLLKDNGNVGDKTYYVKKAELGLDGAHDDELEVGATYVALFTIKDDIASIVSASSLNYKTVYNLGITDNNGDSVATQPIAAELAPYSVVASYQNSDIISNPDKHEMLVYAVGTTEVTATDANRIGIDWNTQNIMKWNGSEWEIVWLYNATLDKYYRYSLSDAGVIYVDWMSEEEFAASYKEIITYVVDSLQEYYNKGNANGLTSYAYAKLRLFDVDNDGLAERSLFKHYSIGKIYKKSASCGVDGDGSKPTYQITDLAGNKVYEQFIEDGHTNHDGKGTKLNSKASDTFAWLNVADFVTTFYNEDGSFTNGSIVVYNVNKTTGEIEIVKHVTAKGAASDDADSYTATGILKGYNTNTATVNIDGEKLPLGYSALTLDGVVFGNVAKNLTTKQAAADILDACQMQYINYTVVDGRVVDVTLRGSTDDVIIVLGYAGVTSDDYIAVYGYNCESTTAQIFRIASYNGWKKGDYRYYPANAWTDEAFVAGTIYTITSYDSATDTYNVYTENTDLDAKENGTSWIKLEFDSGYRIETVNGAYAAAKKMESNQKYIIVYENGTIFVKTGIITDDDWMIEANGRWVGAANAFIFYVGEQDNSEIVGFTETAHEIGFVLYDKKLGSALSAGYDDAIDGDWYLLGSTQTEVRVTDLLTGNTDTCFVSNNIDLVKGRVYITYNFDGNRIILNQWDDEDNHDHNTCYFLDRISDIYTETDVEDARFMVTDDLHITKSNPVTKAMIAEELDLVPDSVWDTHVYDKYVSAMVGDIKYFFYSEADCVEISATDVSKLASNAHYVARAIYDVSTKNVVVYIYAEETVYDQSSSIKGSESVRNWFYDNKSESKGNQESELKVDWSGTYYWTAPNGVKADEEGYTVLKYFTLYFDTVDENHGDIAMNGYLFGLDKMHGRSYFSYNNSVAWWSGKVDGKNINGNNVEQILAGDDGRLSVITMDCDDCSLVTGINLDMSSYNVKITAGNTVTVTFLINGNGSESVNTGNNIKVSVSFTADENGKITEADVTSCTINGTETLGLGVLVGGQYLNSVDLEMLTMAGMEITD